MASEREKIETLQKRITELEKQVRDLERASRRSSDVPRAWLHAIIESLPFDVFALDQEGRYVLQNSTCRQHWGEVLGLRPRDLDVDPDTLATWQENNERAFAGEVVTGDVVLDVKGRPVHMHNIVAPVRVDGEIRGLIGVNIDIEKQKRVEAELRQSEERYRSLVEGTWNGYFIAEASTGRILFSNRIMREMMGYTDEEIRDLTLLDLAIPDQEATARKRVSRRSAGLDLDPSVMLYTAIRKDGTTFSTEVSTSLVQLGGQPVIQGVARDVTEFEQLQEQIRHAEKMHAVGTMAGGISHDFSNLLHAIMGYTQLILQEAGENTALHDHALEIENLAHSAASLSQQLLTFSRRSPSQPTTMNANEEIRKLAKMLERTLHPSIRLELELDPELWSMEADPVQLEQVVMNLAVNARDAMPDGGTLRIATHNRQVRDAPHTESEGLFPGRYVTLTVTDTGEGMTQDVMNRIFEPFFTTKEQGLGTGLGLSVVYGIVTQHKGRVSVQSEPGKGSTFRVHLPASRHEAVPSRPPRKRDSQTGTETLLLVDDEAAILRVGRITLSEQGYEVLTAGDGQQALEMYEKHGEEIDVVIMDVIMPRLDGIDCLDRLRRMDPDVRVILTSGFTDLPGDEDPSELGAARFLRKPYEPSVLLKSIREVIENPP